MVSPLQIVADENIPFVREAFGPYGNVTLRPGYGITPEDVRDADVLLVRSVTKVGPELLAGSPVQFVGSATIGNDHVDLPYLADRGVAFAHAPGSNADSVVEYVMAALLTVAVARGEPLRDKTVGIVGHGNIGSRLSARLPALGMRVLKNDPPLADAAEKSGAPHDFAPLEQVLVESDIITLHVPLTKTGRYTTHHLLNADTLGRMKPGAWLVNTCRGAVIDNAALRSALEAGRLGGAVLDVWENEPAPNLELLDKVDVATPHIAGYSYDGKIQGTLMLYEAFLRHFNRTPEGDFEEAFATATDDVGLNVPDAAHPEVFWLDALVRQMYDIRADDRCMRGLRDVPESERGSYFNRLRKQYPRRRTFSRFHIPDDAITEGLRQAVRQGLSVPA